MIGDADYRVSDSASTEHVSQAIADITVDADGSGSIVFTKIIDIDGGQAISGSVTWKCVEPK
ncbi:hypothetical protein [Catenulispora subtropica]|uniref:Uncharacterized protein n=1 Tax=Catenulispora subtropica TaxID=450798 RepID=A0ABN2SSE7_9ACTN